MTLDLFGTEYEVAKCPECGREFIKHWRQKYCTTQCEMNNRELHTTKYDKHLRSLEEKSC